MNHEASVSTSLIVRLRDGDRDAWRRIVVVFGPIVYRRCQRRGLVGADAEDVTQEVFRAAAGGIARFRRSGPGHSFGAWMAGITRRQIADYYRRRDPHAAAVGGSSARQRLEEVAESPRDEEENWEPSDWQRDVVQRMTALIKIDFEPRTWQAFWRTCVDGRSTAQVAEELGMTSGAIRNARSKVRKRLLLEFQDLLTVDTSGEIFL